MASNKKDDLSNEPKDIPPLPGQLDIEEEVKRQYKIKKNICRTQGCSNKARRLAKREYADNCHKHKPTYGVW